MKKNYILICLFSVFFLLGTSVPEQWPDFKDFKKSPRIPDPFNSPDQKPYYDGMITIKLKEGLGPIEAQKGTVKFNNRKIDKLAVKYELNTVEKRFRHRHIPERSDLPDLSRIYRISFPKKYRVTEVVAAFPTYVVIGFQFLAVDDLPAIITLGP